MFKKYQFLIPGKKDFLFSPFTFFSFSAQTFPIVLPDMGGQLPPGPYTYVSRYGTNNKIHTHTQHNAFIMYTTHLRCVCTGSVKYLPSQKIIATTCTTFPLYLTIHILKPVFVFVVLAQSSGTSEPKCTKCACLL